MADEGRLLASLDYSSQELRVLTEITKDEVLFDIYTHGKDVHATTGVSIYNKKYGANIDYDYFQYCRSILDYLTDENGRLDEGKLNSKHLKQLYDEGKINTINVKDLRKQVADGIEFSKIRSQYAKSTNFGVVYGITEMGLADTLNVTEEEAKGFIDSFLDAYPKVKKWMKWTEQEVRTKKYVTTMLGRKRRVYPEVDSGKRWLFESAVRMAANAQVQGTSADMTKKAAIDLQPLLKELDAQIVLFVHDRLTCRG